MLFSALYKIIVNEVIFFGFRVAIAPPPRSAPVLYSLNKLFQFMTVLLYSEFPWYQEQNSHNETIEKASGEVIWQHS